MSGPVWSPLCELPPSPDAPVLAAAERWERALAAWERDLLTASGPELEALGDELQAAAEALAAAVRARRGTPPATASEVLRRRLRELPGDVPPEQVALRTAEVEHCLELLRGPSRGTER